MAHSHNENDLILQKQLFCPQHTDSTEKIYLIDEENRFQFSFNEKFMKL